jgi:CDP-4-dehydro-6-deoxyglucose reductase, E3
MEIVKPQAFKVRLASSRMLSSNVRELGFSAHASESFAFEAGQWVNLLIPGLQDERGEPLKRAYSIASHPDGSSHFQLAVTKVDDGPGSGHLHTMEVGEELDALGPHGLFVRRESGPALFVGTGTGLTPLRSMFMDALTKGQTAPMTLLFGVRTEADILYRDELQELARKYPHFSVHFTLSQASDQWSGNRGYVQTHARSLYEALKTQGEPHVYICGLQKMVNAVRDLLKGDMGLPRQLIHSERYD